MEVLKRKTLIKTVLGMAAILAGVAYHPAMYLAAVYCYGAVVLEKSPVDIVCLLFAWLNLSPVFKFDPGGASLFTYLELIAVLKLLTMNMRIYRRFLGAWVIYFLYMFLGMGRAYADFIKIAVSPLLLYLMNREIDHNGIKKIFSAYVLGVMAGSGLGLLTGYIPNLSSYVNFKTVNLSYSAATGFVSSSRFSGLWADPNYYSIHLILIISIGVVFFAEKIISTRTFYFLYLLTAFLGAKTGSKSFLMMLVLVSAVLMYSLFRKRQIKQFLFIGIVLIIAVFLIMSGHLDLFSTILSRLQNVRDQSADLTTGRVDIWVQYLQLLSQNFRILVLGNGLGNGFPLRVPHCTYIDFIAVSGIVGTALFAICVFYAVTSGRRPPKGSILPVAMLAIMYFFLSMFYSIDLIFELQLAFSILLFGRKNESLNPLYTAG